LRSVKHYIRTDDALQKLYGFANEKLWYGDLEPFAEMLLKFMGRRTLSVLEHENEGVLRRVVEAYINPQGFQIPKLPLVSDGSKELGSLRWFGYADMFISNGSGTAMVLELKYIRLPWLAYGARQEKSGVELTYSEMEEMDREIKDMEEEELEKLSYIRHDRASGTKECKVSETLEESMQRLERYVRVIESGEAEKDKDSGILSDRVEITDGNDTLLSFVLMVIGGRRVLWRAGRKVQTKYSYKYID
jgi:hypothetical protein